MTFDVIGDLAFGESFDCLKNSEYHAWISIVFDNIKLSAYLRCTLYYPKIIRPLLKLFIPSNLTTHRAEHMEMTRKKALNRLQMKSERVDLLSRLAAPGSGISQGEFISNSGTVIVAGSDTTANLLAGVTHFLSQNKRCYDKLAKEIRSAFKSEEEITLAAVNKLEYLSACLSEALRRYPPTPAHLPRRTNMDDHLAGRFVPKEVRSFPMFPFAFEPDIDPLTRQPSPYLTSSCITQKNTSAAHKSLFLNAGSETPSLRMTTSRLSSLSASDHGLVLAASK
jgi:hypothetical protein